jgi:hypothetical protein
VSKSWNKIRYSDVWCELHHEVLDYRVRPSFRGQGIRHHIPSGTLDGFYGYCVVIVILWDVNMLKWLVGLYSIRLLLRSSLFWDVTRRRLVAGCRNFGTTCGPLKIGIGFSETPATSYQRGSYNVQEQRRPQLHSGRSLKSRIFASSNGSSHNYLTFLVNDANNKEKLRFVGGRNYDGDDILHVEISGSQFTCITCSNNRKRGRGLSPEHLASPSDDWSGC